MSRKNHASDPTLKERLASGHEVEDDAVDRLLPPWVSALSEVHWTPVAVAAAAAAFLTDERRQSARVLDVGAGAGKFCVVGAASTGARFEGVERNPALVGVATLLARDIGVDRVHFHCAAMEQLDWQSYHGLYFFNPFGEYFIEDGSKILEGQPRGWRAYAHQVRTAIAKLYLMPTGTRVATYHGLGASLPPGFDLVATERFGTGILRCYIRRDPLSIASPHPREDFFERPGIFEEPTAVLRPAWNNDGEAGTDAGHGPPLACDEGELEHE